MYLLALLEEPVQGNHPRQQLRHRYKMHAGVGEDLTDEDLGVGRVPYRGMWRLE
jgi:hypothetical protein